MTSPSKPIEHGGALTAACARFGGRAEDWLDLSTGINPLPPDIPNLDPAIWRRLPDDHLFDHAAAAAAYRYGVPEPTVPLPVAGVQAAIQMLPQVLKGAVAVLEPTYSEYRHCFERSGRSVDKVRDMSEIAAHHRVVIVVNPNNPDGRLVGRQRLLALARDMAGRRGYLVVDEAFADLQPEISLAGVAGTHDGLIVLRSFGKYYGMAGLRMGFVLAEMCVREALRRLQGPWAVSGPALAIAGVLMRDSTATAAIDAAIHKRRQALDAVLTGSGLAVVGGTGLFALVDHDRAQAIHQHLCRNRILTRKFDYAPHWMRFGLCPDPESEQRLVRVLSGFG